MKYGFVYIWNDAIRKMYYVGCHWGTVDDGYVCSSKRMKRTYKKRPATFKRRILKTNILSRNEMFEEEQRWLSMIKPNELAIKYYNAVNSSKNHWSRRDETMGAVSLKLRRKFTPEHRLKISIANKGRQFTEEHKKKLAEAHVGVKLSSQHRNAISANHRRGQTQETRIKISNSLRQRS